MIDDYDESSGWMFLLVPAHPGFPGQIPQSRKTVVCVVSHILCCTAFIYGFYLCMSVAFINKIIVIVIINLMW